MIFNKKVYSYIFWPLSLLYGGIIRLRNLMYDWGVLKSTASPIFSIGVGNINVGGTGKTPMVQYLVSALTTDFKVGILSRGYGRKTKGFFEANSESTAITIGDEPMLYVYNFKEKVKVFVGENRVEAINKIHQQLNSINLIILDDCFQHRALTCNINIVLIDYNRLPVHDHLLPLGRLREPVAGLKRAHIIIFSKCPSVLELSEKNSLIAQIREFCRTDCLFGFSSIVYGTLVKFNGYDGALQHVNSFFVSSSIANPTMFYDYVQSNFNIIGSTFKADHEEYSTAEINKIDQVCINNTALITTEKDFVKLANKLSDKTNAYYLPITIHLEMSNSLGLLDYLKNEIKNFYLPQS